VVVVVAVVVAVAVPVDVVVVVVAADAVPPRAVKIPVYAGFFTRSSSQGHAAPCPEKVSGTQEYLSVQSQMVMPTQSSVSTHASTVLA
jgi:hypothetical protein